ncbi:MAG: DNA-directed RNA polymerase subunit H [Candidatus Woesearchaeota archaeon]|nr:MAG: DNA-directed RNA polymerase subunit H [Candidatus Woesearchaeota archaeon]
MDENKKLNFNPHDHVLVPKHTKISEEEKQKILQQYNVSLKQLPKILRLDPALQNIEVQKGDLIKIERKSPTTNKAVVYRVVV